MRLLIYLAMSLISISACAHTTEQKPPPLQSIERLDLDNYLGKWYEIASYPASFQKDCIYTTATYSVRDDGKIAVLNECRKKTPDGKLSRAKGKAWIPNPEKPAELKVQFFWPFRGNYWVIELGENYEYTVISEPKRKYLWILSRTPQMDEATLAGIMDRLENVHFMDLSRLKRTPQPITE